MIPLISIGKALAAVFAAFSAHQAYFAWQREKSNKSFKYLFSGLFLLAIIFSFYIFFPFIENLYFIQAIFYLHDILAVLITFCFISIFLIFLGWQKFQKFLLGLIVFGIFALAPFYIKYFSLATVFSFSFWGVQFIGWTPTLPFLIRISLFGITAGIGLVFVILFLKKAFSLSDPFLKIKGLFFVLGIIFIVLASASSLIYGSFIPTSFLLEIIHILFSILAPLFFLLFIFYKKQFKTGRLTGL